MKKVVFLTGTRADFGKIKPLINILEVSEVFEVYVFVTGMHLQEEYGYTILEVERCNFSNICRFENYTDESSMDLTLSKTIEGLSEYVKDISPDLIVVHGDRVETLAGAIVGSLNNILVAHIEGGELSGTVDELIRHSVSKLSHIHFVSNDVASKRLIQMGELDNSIFTIGSPDLDLMKSSDLPSLNEVKKYYEILFDNFAIALFHPVTTEAVSFDKYVQNFVKALEEDQKTNYVLIFPNNDLGSKKIIQEYKKLKKNSRFRVIPSLRFEYFLTLLKSCDFIIGNSSAGIREAPFYGIPVINIGTRQENRSSNSDIINIDYRFEEIMEALIQIKSKKPEKKTNIEFGKGESAKSFYNCLMNESLWKIKHQKQFRDL